MDRAFVPYPLLPIDALPEELVKIRPEEKGATVDGGDTCDISEMMNSLLVSALSRTPYSAPVEKPMPHRVEKIAPPEKQFAKRAPFSTKTPSRREKVEASGGGFWMRDFDEHGELFRVFFSPDGIRNEFDIVV